MFYTTDPGHRTAFITALRELADFLTSNPAIPVPLFGAEITLYADTYEDGGKAQVEHIARLLHAPITDDIPDGHYSARRSFGRIGYGAVSISDTWTVKRDAQRSYEPNVIFDVDADAASLADPYSLTDCGDPHCTRLNPCDDCSSAINRASVHASQQAWWQ